MTLINMRKSLGRLSGTFVPGVFALSILPLFSLLHVSPLAFAAPQALHFRQSGKPTSYIIVFNASGSTASRLQDERQVVAEFLNTAIPGDEFALVEFHQDAKLSRDFTANASQILADIEGVKASGGTALRDAIALALEELKHARNSQRGILVVANGNDNSSETTAAEIMERAKTAGVPIFAISVSDDSRGAEFLNELARLSGGFHQSSK
jgi:Ca-activated chloride channel homolog